MMHCPLRDLPNNFLDAPHSPFAEPISEQLALHIEQCNDCQQYLAKELDAASVAIRPLVSSPIHGYRILKLLGHGGHASVYLALELSTERQVALKVIPKSPDHTREGQDVWRQEILLAAQMTHPNLLRLYSVQETSNAFALPQIKPALLPS
jgi:serine/threonine protein kinase